MFDHAQHIRKSQFVLIYGPGAIIESRNGPRLIKSINIGLGKHFSSDLLISQKLTDKRLATAIKMIYNYKGDLDVFSFPTNASLGVNESNWIYMTKKFPEWNICYRNYALYKGDRCPICERDDNSSAIRFVAACDHGHLDDVDWHYAVHRGSNCKPDYYIWKSEGSTLSDITVKCPKCHRETTMSEIYKMEFDCTGRFPEKERPKEQSRNKCERKMRVMQRQSTSLRIPVTITLLSLPADNDVISSICNLEKVQGALTAILKEQEPVERKIRKLCDILPGLVNNNENLNINEFCSRIQQIKSDEMLSSLCSKTLDKNREFIDFIYEEFDFLMSNASNPGNTGSDNQNKFIMLPPAKIKDIDINGVKFNFDVYSITRLKTLTAQRGYQREVKYHRPTRGSPQIVDIGVKDHSDTIWYPGFENTGEGILVSLENFAVPKIQHSKGYGEWSRHREPPDTDKEWKEAYEKSIFVWFHTLSHALLRVISLYAGYSLGSLRERVYVNRESSKAAILIYTAMVGGDSSMGGLSGLTGQFKGILEKAVEGIKFCSNDPLCLGVRVTDQSSNGAACHSCLLISETSCEHRNMFLDRHIILGD